MFFLCYLPDIFSCFLVLLTKTQRFTPKVHIIPEEGISTHFRKAKQAVAHELPSVKRTSSKKASASADKAKPVAIALDDDDDDFVSRAAWKLTGKDASKDVPASLPSLCYLTRSRLAGGAIQRDKSIPGRNDSTSSKNSTKRKHKVISHSFVFCLIFSSYSY
jgi:hypothetical protein